MTHRDKSMENDSKGIVQFCSECGVDLKDTRYIFPVKNDYVCEGCSQELGVDIMMAIPLNCGRFLEIYGSKKR